MRFKTKIVALFLCMTSWAFAQDSVSVRTSSSTTIEMYKGRKFAAIKGGTKMTVQETIRVTEDSLFYKSVTGIFLMMSLHDTLVLKPSGINIYCFVKENNKPFLLNSLSPLPDTVFVGPTNLKKIIVRKKAYIFKTDNKTEKVWKYGDPWF